jgi:protein O-GlcNAc transferase
MAKKARKKIKASALRASSKHSRTGRSAKIEELLSRGMHVHQQGDVAGAAQNYREVLKLDPRNAHALHLVGVVHHQNGEHKRAIDLIESSLAQNPDFVDAHINLGAAYFSEGNLVRAEKNFRRATELNPDNAEAHSNLASTLMDLGRVRDAIAGYLAARRANPHAPKFVKRLGDLYIENGQPADAIEHFEQYIEMVPDDSEVLNNMGCALEKLNRPEQAEGYFRRAHEISPESPEIAINLADGLARMGRKDEAKKFFDIAHSASPDEWENLMNVAVNYTRRGDLTHAMALFERLVEKNPDDAELANNYGATLGKMGKSEDALVHFERAIELDPDFADAYNNMGASKLAHNDRKGAIEAFKEVIRIKPRFAAAHVNLTIALLNEQRYDEAYMYARMTVMLEDYGPHLFVNANKTFRGVCAYDDIEQLGNSIEIIETMDGLDFSATFLEQIAITETADEVERLKALHVKWGDQVSGAAAEYPLPSLSARARNAKVRIGFLSSDLRSHSVAKFVYPIMRDYDRDKYEVYCYTPLEYADDHIQQNIKQMVEGFRIVGNKTDREVAECIREDNIDIQFELNGFTKDSKLHAMAFKPAPIQIYWLGYPYTTGMKEMDYIVLDPYFRPENDDFLVETPLLMPESWVCFGGMLDVPISDRTPFERNGFVTFGTLSNTYKFTPESIAVWARVMHEVPNSRFLLVRPECASMTMCTNLAAEFDKHGIGRDRLNFVNNKTTSLSHLEFYDEIDLTLDTFPLVGGTTTCDSLWMGVPVISLVGPNTHQRMGYSILNNVGAGELCALTLDEYIAKGVMLAKDPDSLKQYRHGLRPAMLESPVCDADRYVENFQKMLEQVIEQHGLR